MSVFLSRSGKMFVKYMQLRGRGDAFCLAKSMKRAKTR